MARVHYGIDIASMQHPNGEPIDWPAAFADLSARGGGAQPFVVVKATEGTTYVNPGWNLDAAAAAFAGFAVAVYLFDHGSADPGAETAKFVALVGQLPEALDVEAPDGLSASAYAAHVAAVLALQPRDHFVYLNLSETRSLPGAPWGRLLWLAYPSTDAAPPVPCAMWQYGTGSVAGVPAAVDLDRWTGSEEAFASYFGLTPPAPAPAPTGLAKPAVSILPTNGAGYWIVSADGGVDSYGDAPFYGSLPASKVVPALPVVSAARRPEADGYWLLGGDGGVFAFGNAAYHGHPTGPLAAPPVSIVSTPSGLGYWILGGDGGVFSYGDATYLGSPA